MTEQQRRAHAQTKNSRQQQIVSLLRRQEVVSQSQLARLLAEEGVEVTQATLYRHVGALLEAGFLAVVDERRVRGAVERTLALGDQMAHVDQDGLRAMDAAQLRAAFAEARATKGQPTCIVCETVKGKGVSFMEDEVGWHGKAPNDEQFEQAMAELEAAGKEL